MEAAVVAVVEAAVLAVVAAAIEEDLVLMDGGRTRADTCERWCAAALNMNGWHRPRRSLRIEGIDRV